MPGVPAAEPISPGDSDVRIVATIVLLLGAVPAFAQGPEHAELKKRVGTWTTTMNVAGQETKGTVTYKMELGDFWLVGAVEGELFGAKFTGKSLDTYDPIKKKYVSVWLDSTAPAMIAMEGNFDGEKKTLTMTGDGPDETGKPTKYKSVTAIADDDNEKMTMYVGDAKEPAFTVTYKRKK